MSHNEAVKFTAIECYKKCLWTSKILRWIYGIKKNLSWAIQHKNMYFP